MSIDQIKKSGLLELYVLGDLGPEDLKIVEDALIKYPSLQSELFEIGATLEKYAKIHAVKAPANVLENVLSEIRDKNIINEGHANSNSSIDKISAWTKYQPLVSLLTMLGLAIFLFLNQGKMQDLKKKHLIELENCEDVKNEQAEQLLYLENINNKDNQIIFAEATENYSTTKLYLNHNPISKKNLIQVQNLPGLSDNQSYQLWALKGTDSPIPLDVFQDETKSIFEVQFVEGTDAYAITIESQGGNDTPDLTKLIGVFKIS